MSTDDTGAASVTILMPGAVTRSTAEDAAIPTDGRGRIAQLVWTSEPRVSARKFEHQSCPGPFITRGRGETKGESGRT